MSTFGRPLTMAITKTLVGPLQAPLSSDAGAVGPFPPPTGYRWENVFEDIEPVFEGSERVVELIRIAA